MTRRQLVRAVARSTGESAGTVRRLGFSPPRPAFDLEPEDLELAADCPFCGRPTAVDHRPGPPALAECAACDVEFELCPGDVYAAAAGLAA